MFWYEADTNKYRELLPCQIPSEIGTVFAPQGKVVTATSLTSDILNFPFWETDPSFYSRLDNLFIKSDLVRVHLEIAAAIARVHPCGSEISWLDIGSGDGTTICNILNCQISSELSNIKLDCVEPSKAAGSLLTRNLASLGIQVNQLHQKPVSEAIFSQSYDIITCLHTSYYFGFTEHQHDKTWSRLSDSLSERGILVVCVLPESSPFFALASPAHFSDFGKAQKVGESLRRHFRRVESKTLSVRIPTNVFDIVNAHRNLISFYEFLHHVDTEPTPEQLDELRDRLRAYHTNSRFIDMCDELIIAGNFKYHIG